MRRIAFVVEGQTEQIFVQKFLQELNSAEHPTRIMAMKDHGGRWSVVSTRGSPAGEETHSILIMNVENDDRTITWIEENLANLKSKGYEAIFGLRDLYTGDSQKQPLNPVKIDARTSLLASQNGIRIEITIAIQELEAWFLSVPSFFEKADQSLTVERIKQTCAVDLSAVDVETILHPAKVIRDIFETVGKTYKKRSAEAHSIANALDYDKLYVEKAPAIRPLKRFVEHLTWALA